MLSTKVLLFDFDYIISLTKKVNTRTPFGLEYTIGASLSPYDYGVGVSLARMSMGGVRLCAPYQSIQGSLSGQLHLSLVSSLLLLFMLPLLLDPQLK